MRGRSLGVTLAMLALAACGSSSEPEPPEGFPLAYAMDDCAPWDGPATSVFLTSRPLGGDDSPSPPFVRISIYLPRGDVVGHSFALSAESASTGAVSRCESEASCVQAVSALVRFRDASPEEPLAGRISAIFPGGERVVGGFVPTPLPSRGLCG